MRIRHTVIFTFYEKTTREQIDELILRLNTMGQWLQDNASVTDWVIAEHISETYKGGRAHLLQDGIFPDTDSLDKHASSEVHKKVLELAQEICDWMTIDTIVSD